MGTPQGAIVRKSGISVTIFAVSLIVVAVGAGLGGYFVPKLFPSSSSSNLTLTGAGSTFVYPLISAIDTNYTAINPHILINYQAVGSGTGINDLSAKTVEFGASDAPLSSTQIQSAPNTVTIPDTIGAVVIGYDLPGISSGLQLNVSVAAQIFNGNINNWNASEIRALNPTLTLPNQPITIVHRSDSSGTTFVFSGWLSSSPDWGLGQSKTITWPAAAIGANGNPGVAAVVQGTKYAVGYVELDYALSASPAITYANIWSSASNAYITPTIASTTLAASNLPSLPSGDNATAWQSINLLNSNTQGAYPIVTFSYIMVFKELNVYGSAMSLTTAQDLVNLLWFVVHQGQNQATPLYYVALPANVVANAESSINSITYNGSQVHS